MVSQWINSNSTYHTHNISFDDESQSAPSGPLIEVETTTIDDFLSSGTQVAFHTTQTGPYLGGAGKDDRKGELATLRSAGIVQVHSDTVIAGHIIRDRSGLFA